jgi:hypothetical protein
MKMHSKWAFIGVACFILVAALAGCGSHIGSISTGSRVLSAGNNVPGHFNASYQLFSGEEGQWVTAKAGQSIDLSYAGEAQKGSLSFVVRDANKTTLWSEDLVKITGGSTKVPVEQSGDYAVVVVGQETQGSFEVSWQVE